MKTTIRADNSQINTFTSCPRKWYYANILNLQSKGAQKPALDKGTIFHALLDFFYRKVALGASFDEAYKYSIETFQRNYKKGLIPSDLSANEIKFLASRFFHYYSYYSVKGDYRPMVVMGRPQIEVGFSITLAETAFYLYILEGKIDMITSDHFFVDHKTQSRFYDHYRFDPQLLTYGIATGCTQAVYNYIGLQQKVDTDTFRRLPHKFSAEKLEQYKKYLISVFHKMALCIQQNNFPEEYTACSGKYGPCQFHVIDEPTNSAERKMNLLATFTNTKPQWQPWELKESI